MGMGCMILRQIFLVEGDEPYLLDQSSSSLAFSHKEGKSGFVFLGDDNLIDPFALAYP